MHANSAQLWISVIGALVGALAGGLISALVAWRVFAGERRAASSAAYEQAVARSAEGVLDGLARLVAIDPLTEAWRVRFAEVQARATIFRAVARGEDVRAGEWLSLELDEGLRLFGDATARLAEEPVATLDRVTEFEILIWAHGWAENTMQVFARWLPRRMLDLTMVERIAELRVLKRPGAAE